MLHANLVQPPDSSIACEPPCKPGAHTRGPGSELVIPGASKGGILTLPQDLIEDSV